MRSAHAWLAGSIAAKVDTMQHCACAHALQRSQNHVGKVINVQLEACPQEVLRSSHTSVQALPNGCAGASEDDWLEQSTPDCTATAVLVSG